MALKLDDLLTKKKEPVQILDLSKSTANSKEELKKLLEKVPEFKIKIDKVKPEDVKIYDRKFNFKTSKKELRHKIFPFINPVPSEMKSLRLDDLCSVGIQWKMLTSLRPKSKLDEEYYSKMVELGKLQLAAREKEKKIPLASYIRKSKNRAGVLETKIVSCRECGEEFCSTETCRQFAYDVYERVNVTTAEELTAEGSMEKGHKKKRKKRVSKKTTRLKKKTKTKIGSKATSVGKSTRKSPTMHKSEAKANKPPVTVSVVKKQSTRSKPSKGRENSKNSKSKRKLENMTGRTNTKKPLSKLQKPRKVGKKGANSKLQKPRKVVKKGAKKKSKS